MTDSVFKNTADNVTYANYRLQI